MEFGLQLYSVRDYMSKDVFITLKRVKEIGYNQVEVAGLYGYSGKEFKELLDKSKLSCVSAHQGYSELLRDDNGKLLQDYIDLGVKYLVVPWTPKETIFDHELYHEMLDKIKELYALVARHGIKLAYHNHEYEFARVDGKLLFDEIYDTVGRDKLSPELDVCWADYAGFSPVEVIARYSGCMEIMHIKNYTCQKKVYENEREFILKDSEEKKKESNFRFQTINIGKIDMLEVIERARLCGVKYAFVEMDDCYGADSLECAATSAKFLQENYKCSGNIV